MKRILIWIIIAIFTTNSLYAFAAEGDNFVLRLTGAIDASLYNTGITVVVFKEGADFFNPSPDDFEYINQVPIDQNGCYELNLEMPLLEYDGSEITNYSVHSNSDNMYVGIYDDGVLSGLTHYVSSENSLQLALSEAESGDTIVVSNEIILSNGFIWPNDSKSVTITGKSGNTVVGSINITGITAFNINSNVIFDDINFITKTSNVLYANGKNVVIGDNIEMSNPITAYGGSNGISVESTHLTLKSGKYTNAYGGGNSGGVTGDTNLMLGGTVNFENSVIDDESNYVTTRAYGGCNDALVGGRTNVTLQDSAKFAYIIGGGYIGGVTGGTYININGGSVMNVYGGSSGAAFVGDTHINMTGGYAEALFGGCYAANLTGNTFIRVTGGDISRRIYTGCYNDYDIYWKSDAHVIGTTNLIIGGNPTLTEGINGEYDVNWGVFAGSRAGDMHADEINTVIFLDNTWQTHGSKLKTYGTSVEGGHLIPYFKSFHNYLVKVSANGNVEPTSFAGKVLVEKEFGQAVKVNNVVFEGTECLLPPHTPLGSSPSVSEIVFLDDYKIHSLSSTRIGDGATAQVDVTANNIKNENINPILIVVFYDENNNCVHVELKTLTPPVQGTQVIDVGGVLEGQKTYTVKAMLWRSLDYGLSPLTSTYSIIMP